MAFELRDIQKLSELLKQPEDSDSEDDLPQSGLRKMGKSPFVPTISGRQKRPNN